MLGGKVWVKIFSQKESSLACILQRVQSSIHTHPHTHTGGGGKDDQQNVYLLCTCDLYRTETGENGRTKKSSVFHSSFPIWLCRLIRFKKGLWKNVFQKILTGFKPISIDWNTRLNQLFHQQPYIWANISHSATDQTKQRSRCGSDGYEEHEMHD